MKSAPDFLTLAADTLRARGVTYDQPSGERSMGRAVAAWNALTGREMSVYEGWLFMMLLKCARQSNSPEPHFDSALDAIAYMALAAEALGAGD